MVSTLRKRLYVLLAVSTLLQFGGCLSRAVSTDLLIDGVKYVGFEWILDNDGVFDLFAD